MTHDLISAREDNFKTYLPVMDLTRATRTQQILDHIEAHYPCDNFEGEDALDQETVRFEDIEAALAYDYHVGVARAEDIYDTMMEYDWALFEKCVLKAPAGKLKEGVARYQDIVHAWDE
jgi:hypothetical protein